MNKEETVFAVKTAWNILSPGLVGMEGAPKTASELYDRLTMPQAKPTQAQPATPAELLTIEETARKLKCSEKTIRNMIADGRLKAIRRGRVVRIPESELYIQT